MKKILQLYLENYCKFFFFKEKKKKVPLQLHLCLQTPDLILILPLDKNRSSYKKVSTRQIFIYFSNRTNCLILSCYVYCWNIWAYIQFESGL